MTSSRSAVRALTTLLVGMTLAPALRAQPTPEGIAGSVAPAPAGVVAAPRAAVAIQPSMPASWSRSLARADSLAPRKHAFHIGAVAGAVASSGFVLALMQPWKGDQGETRAPGGRAVAAAMLAAAIPGALLGGVAGVIVHDVHGAVRGR